jgi:hypothetical protein
MSVVATIPKDQKFVYRVTPVNAGWMDAAMIGKQITAIAGLVKAAACEDGPRMAVVLTGCAFLEGNALEFEFAVLPYGDPTISRNHKK